MGVIYLELLRIYMRVSYEHESAKNLKCALNYNIYIYIYLSLSKDHGDYTKKI